MVVTISRIFSCVSNVQKKFYTFNCYRSMNSFWCEKSTPKKTITTTVLWSDGTGKNVINRVAHEERKNWNRIKSTHHQCIAANVFIKFLRFLCDWNICERERETPPIFSVHTFSFLLCVFNHKYKIWIFTLFANHFQFKQIIASSCFLTPFPTTSFPLFNTLSNQTHAHTMRCRLNEMNPLYTNKFHCFVHFQKHLCAHNATKQ